MKVCEKCGKAYEEHLTKCLYCGHQNKEDIEKNKKGLNSVGSKGIKPKVGNVNKGNESKGSVNKSSVNKGSESKGSESKGESDNSDLNILLSEETIKKRFEWDRTNVTIGVLSLAVVVFMGSTFVMYKGKEKSELAHSEDLVMMDSVLNELITTEESLEEVSNQLEMVKGENEKLTLKLDSLISGVGEEGRSVYDFGSIYYIKNKEFDNVYPTRVLGESAVIEMNNYLFSLINDEMLEYYIRYYLGEYKKILNNLNGEFLKLNTMEEVKAKVKEVVEQKDLYKSEYGNQLSLLEIDKFTRALVGNATTRELNYIKMYVDEYNNLSKWKNTITNPVSELDVFKMNIGDLKKAVDKNGYSEALVKNGESFRAIMPKTAIEVVIERSACSDIVNYINDNKVTVDVVESSLYVCMMGYEQYLNKLAGVVKSDNMPMKYKELLGQPIKVDGMPEGVGFIELRDTIEWLLVSGKKAGYRLYGFQDMLKTLDETHINIMTRPSTYVKDNKLKNPVVKDIANTNTQTYKLLEGKKESVIKLITEVKDRYSSYKLNMAQLQATNSNGSVESTTP